MADIKQKSKKELQDYLTDRYKKMNDAAKEKWDTVSCKLPKGTKDRIKAQGLSINGYINRLVLEDLEKLEK